MAQTRGKASQKSLITSKTHIDSLKVSRLVFSQTKILLFSFYPELNSAVFRYLTIPCPHDLVTRTHIYLCNSNFYSFSVF